MSLLQAEPVLDDDDPGHGAPPRPPRRRLRRVLIGLNVFLVVCIAAVGGVFAYTTSKFAKIDRETFGVDETGQAILTKAAKGAPFNVLLVGSDSRKGFSKAQQAQFGSEGRVGGQRSDTMMVVRIDPGAGRATVLSIPRDLDVALEGGGRGRINEAFAKQGDQSTADPDRLVRTITANLGITINHYMEVGFDAFRRVVDAVGGVSVHFPFPARDDFSDLKVDQTGCVKLDGVAALAYVRSRHYEFRKDGRWQVDPTGDLGRIHRQQEFMRRVVSRVRSSGLTNPIELNRIIDAGVENLRVDEGFSTADLRRLALQLKDTDPAKITYLSVPTEPFTRAGADLLRPAQPATDQVLVAFGARPLTPATGSKATTARVTVLNGTSTTGLAAKLASSLAAAGFSAAPGGNASGQAAATTVRYGDGAAATATAISTALGGTPRVVADRRATAGTVTVVVGADHTRLATPKPATTTTTATTAPPAAVAATSSTTAPKGSDFSVTC